MYVAHSKIRVVSKPYAQPKKTRAEVLHENALLFAADFTLTISRNAKKESEYILRSTLNDEEYEYYLLTRTGNNPKAI
jgi:hypothetical protein